MRSSLKILISVVVLGGLFVSYLLWQPPAAPRTATNRPPPQAIQQNEGDLLVGEGENAWVRQFDDQGRLASRFRAEKWEPQKDGLVRVVRPEAELYLKGAKNKPRSRVTIAGDEGEVIVSSLPGAGAAETPLDSKKGNTTPSAPTGPMQPPSSGRLNGVVIRVFEKEDDETPILTLRTNNIVFDNETFRLSTEEFRQPDGTTVPGDQVPIIIVGRDIDFSGRGLTVRWNDVDQRLELLRIAHGEYLRIKNTAALTRDGVRERKARKAAATVAWNNWTRGARRHLPLWPMIASADPATVAGALEAAGAKKEGRRKDRKKSDLPGGAPRADEQPPYRASFDQKVRIVQGDETLAVADVMNIEFLLGGGGPSTRKSSATATAPANSQPVATRPAESQPARTQPADTQPADTQPSDAQPSGTQPSTAPAAEPVTVYWDGELTVTPRVPASSQPTPASQPAATSQPASSQPATSQPAASPMPELDEGEASVELIGSPVVLTRENTTVRCARLTYATDGRLAVDRSEDFPQIELTQRPTQPGGHETVVTTEGVRYSLAERQATLTGASRVVAPLGADKKDKDGLVLPQMLDAAWNDSAVFHLVGESEEQLSIERAVFAGDVDAKSPQGAMKAQTLEMMFEQVAQPPAAASNATETSLAGGPEEEPEKRTPTTKGSRKSDRPQPVLRRVVAAGDVNCELADAKQGTRTVACQRLELETEKDSAGELYPRTVVAQDDVRASDGEQDLSAGRVVLMLKPSPRATAEKKRKPKETAEPSETGNDTVAGTGTVETPHGREGEDAVARRDSRPDEGPASDTPPVELESLLATAAVKVTSKDGAVATGERLVVVTDEHGDPRVELSGAPARVVDADNGAVTGPLIVVLPKASVVRVPGAGSLRTVHRDKPKPGEQPKAEQPGRPIEITWADGAHVDGAADKIEVNGRVALTVNEPDGAVRTATAGRVLVRLVPKPVEEKKQAGKAEKKQDEPAKELAGAEKGGADKVTASLQMDLFKDKEVGAVTLHDDTVINSRLLAPDGSVLQQFHLKAPVVTYDVAKQHLSVPGPGQMLVENHPPGEKAAARARADAAERVVPVGMEAKQEGPADDTAEALTGFDGTTAFQWQESLEFDEAAYRATMSGGVVVSYQADDSAQPPVRLDAEWLVAQFEPEAKPGKEGQAAGQKNADDEGPKVPKLRLKSVSADGNIIISRDGAELTANRIDFDPETQWVIARGSDRQPAIFSDPDGTQSTTARELWVNTKTWSVKVKDAATRVGGLTRPRTTR